MVAVKLKRKLMAWLVGVQLYENFFWHFVSNIMILQIPMDPLSCFFRFFIFTHVVKAVLHGKVPVYSDIENISQ
jgi:hypothetical protein